MTVWSHDLRYAFRLLRKSPGFTLLAIATLSLGIGASTGIVLVGRAMLFRPLPYTDPTRLLVLSSVNPRIGWTGGPLSVPDVVDVRERSTSFASISGITWTDYESFSVTGRTGAQRINGVAVLPHLFDTLDAHPLLGRDFLPSEFFGPPRVALLGYRTWKDVFGGSPGLVGQTIRVNREPYTVVGILAPQFELPRIADAAQILVPLSLESSDAARRKLRLMWPFGRLKPGAAMPQAQSEMEVIGRRLAAAHPEDDGFGVHLGTLRDGEGLDDARQKLPIFLATVLLLMIVAGANVAGILLSRFAARRAELAIRTALGASRGRLIRQLTTESLLIAVSAGGLGLIVALWVADLVLSFKPFYIPFDFSVRLDLGTVLAVAALSVAIGIVFGCLPALTVASTNLHDVMKRAAGRVSGGWQERLRNGLVIAEVAMSVAFLVGAALMVSTMWHISRVPVGFDPRGLSMGRITLDPSRYGSPESQRAFYDALLAKMSGTPGVEVATAASHLVDFDPSGWSMGAGIRVPGSGSGTPSTSFVSVVMPGYFGAMGVPMRRGIDFSGHESIPSIIVDQTFADTFFPHADPIGRQVALLEPPMRDDEDVQAGLRTIVGVVPVVRRIASWATPFPHAYVPFTQNPVPSMFAIARSRDGSGGAAIRRGVAALDRDVAIYRSATMESWITRFYASQRFELLVLSVFAAIALAIAASGLYAVIAYRVAQRTRELGVRLALGATPSSLQRLVLRQAAVLTAVGLAVGVGTGAGVSRMLAKFLFGVRPFDPASLAGAAVFVGCVALIAAYVPIRRAVLADPIVALRAD